MHEKMSLFLSLNVSKVWFYTKLQVVTLTTTSIVQFGTHERKGHMGVDNLASKVPNPLVVDDDGMLSKRCRGVPRYHKPKLVYY